MEEIQRAEESILNLYHKKCHTKKPNYKLSNQVIRGVIKLNSDYSISNHFVIKIIGIWESNREYGLTYRITNHL